MNPKQLQNLSYRTFYKAQKKLKAAAKRDPQLVSLAEMAEKLWMETHKLAEARLLAVGQKRDKGEVLWTVFAPILCGPAAAKKSMGTSETIRTPNCVGTRHLWDSDSEHPSVMWRPATGGRDYDIEWDFHRAMEVKAA